MHSKKNSIDQSHFVSGFDVFWYVQSSKIQSTQRTARAVCSTFLKHFNSRSVVIRLASIWIVFFPSFFIDEFTIRFKIFFRICHFIFTQDFFLCRHDCVGSYSNNLFMYIVSVNCASRHLCLRIIRLIMNSYFKASDLLWKPTTTRCMCHEKPAVYLAPRVPLCSDNLLHISVVYPM